MNQGFRHRLGETRNGQPSLHWVPFSTASLLYALTLLLIGSGRFPPCRSGVGSSSDPLAPSKTKAVPETERHGSVEIASTPEAL